MEPKFFHIKAMVKELKESTSSMTSVAALRDCGQERVCFLTGVVEPGFCVQVPKPLKFLRPHYSTLTEHYAKVAPDCLRQYQKADDPVLPCNAVMTFDTFYLILPNREEQQKDQQRSRNNKDAESAKQGGTLCVFLSFFPSCLCELKVQNLCLCRCLLAT